MYFHAFLPRALCSQFAMPMKARRSRVWMVTLPAIAVTLAPDG